MKFLALQVLALCGLAALTAQPIAAEEPFISTCDVECVGPLNACGWEVIAGKGTQDECNRQNEKCLKDCYAKNGKKKFVYKEQPHPEATATQKPKTKTPKTKKPKTKEPKANLRSMDEDEN